MRSEWRNAGISYINLSSIAARLVRRALKSEFQKDAKARDASAIKFKPWKDGKPEVQIADEEAKAKKLAARTQ